MEQIRKQGEIEVLKAARQGSVAASQSAGDVEQDHCLIPLEDRLLYDTLGTEVLNSRKLKITHLANSHLSFVAPISRLVSHLRQNKKLKSLMYVMPAEWQPQTATWLSWPHNEETWPENLASAQAEFVAFAIAIASVQPVKVMCAGAALQQASQAISGIDNLELVSIATNDAWARDYAPTFVRNDAMGKLMAVNWDYNAWGGKYPPYDQDRKVGARVAEHLGIDVVSPGLCFEGGGIEVNESGTMLCTKSCALDPNRNPEMTLEKVESIFKEHLGVTAIIWLSGDAIEGDDTDGHIDQLARFTDDSTIAYAWSDDEDDPQREGLTQNLNDLRTGLAAVGRDNCRLIPLPIPPEMNLHGRRIPASYCNFLICNGLVIVPQFGNEYYDLLAMRTLKPLFPQHRLVGLESLNLTVGLGSFHCLSQQQPAL